MGRPGTWKKGQSGNPGGRPRKRLVSAEIRTVGNLRDDDGVMNKRALAVKLWQMALTGDMDAIRLIYEYCDGKPVQRNEVSGPDGGPIPLAFDHSAAVADLTGDEAGSGEDSEAQGTDQSSVDGQAVGQDDDGR